MCHAGIAGRLPRRYRRATVGDLFAPLPWLLRPELAPTRSDELWVGGIAYMGCRLRIDGAVDLGIS